MCFQAPPAPQRAQRAQELVRRSPQPELLQRCTALRERKSRLGCPRRCLNSRLLRGTRGVIARFLDEFPPGALAFSVASVQEELRQSRGRLRAADADIASRERREAELSAQLAEQRRALMRADLGAIAGLLTMWRHWRGEARRVARLRPSSSTPKRSANVARGAYSITGGLGGLGLRAAALLVAEAQAIVHVFHFTLSTFGGSISSHRRGGSQTSSTLLSAASSSAPRPARCEDV